MNTTKVSSFTKIAAVVGFFGSIASIAAFMSTPESSVDHHVADASSYSSQANTGSASAGGVSEQGSCSSYAGPNGASSSCAHKGRSASSHASDSEKSNSSE